MNYSTAKTIFRVYKKEKRILRKYPSKADCYKEAKKKKDIDKLIILREYIILFKEFENLSYTIQKYNLILYILSKLICKLFEFGSEL